MLKRIDKADDKTIVIEFSRPMKTVSTVPVMSINGIDDTGIIDKIVFHNVSEELDLLYKDLISYYIRILRRLDLDKSMIFLTAASLDNMKRISLFEDNVEIFMTIGFEPASCIEYENIFEPLKISTINIVVAINYPLTINAMTDLLKTIVEAKTLASSDILLRCRSRSSGTITDAIAILRPAEVEEKILFAGIATYIGNKIAREIYNAVKTEYFRKGEEYYLKNILGLDLKELLEIFSDVYRRAPLPDVDEKIILKEAEDLLREFLKDPNVWSMIIAARELDLHGIAETIPYLTRSEYKSDSKKIVADEIIGISLAMYLSGLKGLFAMYWIERLKEDKSIKYFTQDNMFEDDIISAIIASLLTRILDKYMSRGLS
jgi:alpha-ribazole phosphatase CobZ